MALSLLLLYGHVDLIPRFILSGAGSVCGYTQSSSQMLVHQSPGAMWVGALQVSDPAAEERAAKKGFIH